MSSLAAERPRARPRRLALAAVAVVVAAAALVAIGRAERARWVDAEVPGMERTLAAVGDLDSPSPAAYRVLPRFDCLAYRRGEQRLALDVCVDGEGRVVETIDRRGAEPRIDSLRAEPGASPVRVDRALVDSLLRRLGAPCCR